MREDAVGLEPIALEDIGGIGGGEREVGFGGALAEAVETLADIGGRSVADSWKPVPARNQLKLVAIPPL